MIDYLLHPFHVYVFSGICIGYILFVVMKLFV